MSSIETVDNISSADVLRPAGDYTVSSFVTNGSGTGAVFIVTINPIGVASIAIKSKGSNYAENDTITITDLVLGNNGGADLRFSIASIS